jgi:hypothetical protein
MKGEKMKKKIIILESIVILLLIGSVIYLWKSDKNKLNDKPLPKQELSEGLRGVYGIDKNINEKTIDNYLGRKDTVYRDVRLLMDTATWENKGGTRELTGFVKGFEVVPYAYLTEFPQEYIEQKKSENVSGLYTGKTLFSLKDGKYIANYDESMEILEYLFPKDKYIFIMCGAGGYANFTKKMLISLGWDEKKIYNIGGYWNYKGTNNISTVNKNGAKVTYDFWKVPYYNIDFNSLHKVK